VERHPEDLPAKEVDRAARVTAFLDGPSYDPLDEGRGRGMAQYPLRPVLNDRAEGGRVVRGDPDEGTDRESGPEGPLESLQPLGGPGEDRPEGREADLALGQERVGRSERPQERDEVRATDPHVVQNHDRGSGIPSNPPEQSREDLGHREAPPIEPFVETLEQGRRNPLRSPEERGPNGEDPGKRFSERRSDPVGYLTRRSARDGRRSRAAGALDPDDPWTRSVRFRRVEAADDLGQFLSATQDDRREPVFREHLRVGGRLHRYWNNYGL